jgi:hypothetical protein
VTSVDVRLLNSIQVCGSSVDALRNGTLVWRVWLYQKRRQDASGGCGVALVETTGSPL